MTDWNQLFGLDSAPVGIQNEAGGPQLSEPSPGLSPADLQALAGYVPNTGTGAESAAQSPLGSPGPLSPYSPGPLSPGVQSQNTPAQTPLSSSQSQGGKVGVKTDVSTTGFDPGKYDSVIAKTRSSDLAGSKASRDQAGAYEQKTGQEYNDALGLKGQSIVDQTALNSKIAESKAQLASEEARLMNEHAGEIEKMQAVVQAKTDKAAANYANQLALIGATRIDHNQLYHDKGTAGKIAMLASSFVGGILDAKGVKNNIQATLMKTIDDSVSDQIANLNNQQNVAAGFKQLYDMAVADGSNQIQAKTKLQGMYLTAFEQQAKAELDKYGSELAKTTGQAALADLAMEKANIFKKVRDDAFDQFNKLEGNRITQRGQNIQAGIASARLAFDKQVEAHKQEATKAAASAGALDNIKKLVINNTDGSISRIAYDEDSAKLARKTHAAASQVDQDVAELRDLIKKAGGLGMKGRLGTMLNDVDEKRAQALYNRVISNELRVQSGAAVNEAEVERKTKEIGDGSWLAIKSGGVDAFEQTLRDHERLNLQAVEKYDQQYSMSVPDDVRAQLEAQGLSGRSIGDSAVFGKNRREEIGQLDEKARQEASGYVSPEDRLAQTASAPHSQLVEAKGGTPKSWQDFAAASDLGNTRDAQGNKQPGEIFNAPDWKKTEYAYVPALDQLKEEAASGNADSAKKLIEVAATARDKTQADYALFLADLAHVGYDKEKLNLYKSTFLGKPGQTTDFNATPRGNDISLEDLSALQAQ